MALATHVNPEEIIQRLQASHITSPGHTNLRNLARSSYSHFQPFESNYAAQENIPKYKIPEDGAPADTVYQMVRDELDLDGKPNLNLASFVGTFMEPNAMALMQENIAKNLADADEYPALMDIHQRCISIIAHMWGVQPGERAIGSATTGSSEAIHLGGLAMKRRWQERRRAEGKDASKPNIIMGANAQVALEKFARYFEVEARILPVSAKSRYCLDPDLVRKNIDENTIGVFVILGSTYTGHYEPVEEISRILDEFEAETGVDIPIHVDGASGAFIAPFTDAGAGGPKWNFELPRVKSINTSGHKFGLVYAGLGWIIWRDEAYLPDFLVFELHYLGGTEKSFTLNFSRPGAQVVAQYFNLVHLGHAGYRSIMENCLANARLLSNSLEATGYYTVVSEIHHRRERAIGGQGGGGDGTVGGAVKSAFSQAKRSASAAAAAAQQPGQQQQQNDGGETAHNGGHGHGHGHKHRHGHHHGGVGGGGGVTAAVSPFFGGETSSSFVAGLPVVAFHLSDKFRSQYPHIHQETVSLMLRAKSWIIPNYALPPDADKLEILRVVVRETMSFDLLEKLVTDIVAVTETLMEKDEIDLDTLRDNHAVQRGPVTQGDREKKEKEKREGKSAAGKRHHHVRRMAGGIHHSVC